jgi:hypothetical protein
MKTPTTFILFLTAILTLAAGSVSGSYSGGTGEPNNPYQIATKADLLTLAADTNDYSKCFILTADIDMQGQVFTTAIIAPDTNSIRSGFQGTSFTGTFDGNSHKITHFTINGGSNAYLGLFGYVDYGGSIKNLGLGNCSVSGSYDVGGLVGCNVEGDISQCYSTGSVSVSNDSYNVGGLVGQNFYGSISNCHSTGSVSGHERVGGLVGYNDSGSISNCYSMGAVSGSSGCDNVGGLVGFNDSGSVSNCYSTGAVIGSFNVGGLVGGNGGNIKQCYSTGSVSGGYSVGGLVGYNYGSISGCYFLITSGPNNGYGTPLTDAQMKQQISFVGWDFTNETANGTNDYWRMCVDGVDYPHLNWESMAGDFACPNGVNMEDLGYFVQRWLESDCASSNNYCGGRDLNVSGMVDFKDFAVLAEDWLKKSD